MVREGGVDFNPSLSYSIPLVYDYAASDLGGPDDELIKAVRRPGKAASTANEGANTPWLSPLNTTNGSIGLLAGAVEHLSGKVTVGSNGKLYKSGWRGNQYVSTTKVTRIGKTAGNATLVFGTALDIYGVRNYYKYGESHPNSVYPGKAVLNFGIGAWGTMNPATAIGAGMYFGIDVFYPGGFPAAMEKSAEIQRRERAILGFYPRD